MHFLFFNSFLTYFSVNTCNAECSCPVPITDSDFDGEWRRKRMKEMNKKLITKNYFMFFCELEKTAGLLCQFLRYLQAFVLS